MLTTLAPTSPIQTTLAARFYWRISEDRTGERLGVDRQAPPCYRLCDQLGFLRGKEYEDNDTSATKLNVRRDGFERLLIDLNRDPSPVIVLHTDRLIRVSRDLERVIETGVNVHAVQTGHLELSTPAGRAVARTVTAWAQYEGEQKALRQVGANQQKAGMGKPTWSRRPFGYQMDGTLHPVESVLVRKAFDDVLVGASLHSIVCEWNSLGIKTTLGNSWDATGLRWVLKAARNARIATYKEREVGQGNWDALISEETFRATRRLLANPARRMTTNTHGRQSSHLLPGIAVCAECEGPVGTNLRRWKDSNYRILVCRKKACSSIPMRFVDDLVQAAVIARLADSEAAALWTPDENSIEHVRAKATQLRQELTEWATDRASHRVTREQMLTATAQLQPQLEAAEAELSRLLMGTPLHDLTAADEEGVATWWDGLPIERRRAVVCWVLGRVAIHSRGPGGMRPRPEHVQIEPRT